MTYNEIIQQAGKRISIVVYYIANGTTTTLNEDNVGKIKLYTKSNLIGTAITGCDIETKELLDGDVYIQINASYQEHSASKTYGPYYIKEQPKYDANKKNYTYTLYDGMIKSMTNYKELEPKNMFDIKLWDDLNVSTYTYGDSWERNGESITFHNTSGRDLYLANGVVGLNGTVGESNAKYFISCKPNTTYTISFDKNSSDFSNGGGDSSYVDVLNENRAAIDFQTLAGDFGSRVVKTFTTGASAKYILFRFGVRQSIGSITYSNIMLQEGDGTYFEPFGSVYPITLYDYFKALCEEIGYTTNIASLPNGSNILSEELYADIGYTFRDVLDDIGSANGVLFYIDRNEIKIAQRTQNVITINDDLLKNQNIDFGQHFGPINSIVLSRSAESDNIYERDEESIAEYGLHEFKIKDNEILKNNDRDTYKEAIAEQLFGTEYDVYDTELVGYGDVNLLDTVNFTTSNKTYSSYIFNNEIVLTTGYKQTIYNEMPEESETDYKKADKTDNMINQAYIIVDKQNSRIDTFTGKVTNLQGLVDTQGKNITELGTRITTTEQGWQTNVTAIQTQLANGVSLVKTTSVTINNDGLNVTDDTSKIQTTMTTKSFLITPKGDTNTKLAFIGYDENQGASVAKMDNLTITNYFTNGYHRTEGIKNMTNARGDTEDRTCVFYIGG